MAIPDFQTLMLPVLQGFGRGATTIKEILPEIQAQFNISGEEAAELNPSGTATVLANRAHWARTYMSKAGLLTSPKRGIHLITEEGKQVLSGHLKRLDISILAELSHKFEDWRSASRNSNISTDPDQNDLAESALTKQSATPEESLGQAIREMQAELKDELLSLLRGMDPIAFERLVLKLLEAMGYGAGDLANKLTTKASGDGGIDGIIHEDALGLDAVYIQAKRYAAENKVSRPAIQQFVGSLTGESANKGVFVTTSGFSAEAKDFVRRVQQRIVLIDGDEFARLMIRHNVGVRTVQTYEIKAVDENVFAEI